MGGGEDAEGPVVWSRPAETANTVPAIAGSRVFFGGNNGAVWALDRASGELLWRRTLIAGYPVQGEALSYAAGLVLAPIWGLEALDAETGEVVWSFFGPDGAAAVRTAVTAGDTVFTASAYGWASAVDVRTGEAYWSVDLEESVWPPAVSADLVIYGTRSWQHPEERRGALGAGHVVALRRRDGSEAWRFPLPDSTGFPGSGGAISGGVVWEDRVIVGGKNAWVYALRLEDGSLIWKAPNGQSPVVADYTSRPAILDDLAILGRANDTLDAWNAETGKRAWGWGVPAGLTDPIVVKDYVYSIDGPITIGDASGNILWQFGGGDPDHFLGARAYFLGNVADDGMIYTLKAGPFRDSGTFIHAIRPPITP